MSEPIIVAEYDPAWPEEFLGIGRRLRAALGPAALRIDHIGSTAVPGLAAKPVIDVQIAVAALEPMDYRAALEGIGFAWRASNPDLTKRYFREQSGRRIHVHVRRAGSWSEQFALLFRDFLRASPAVASEYAALKYRLAATFREQREAYVEAKGPFIWETIRRASEWSQASGWQPGPSDC